MNNILPFVLSYIFIGLAFLFTVRKRLTNGIYRNLTLYYYKYSNKVKSLYVLSMRTCVFVFWPIFLIALIVDLVIEYIDRKNERQS